MTLPTHLVTGATDGIGLETAAQLAQRGARVLVHGRSQAKAVAACATLRERQRDGAFVPVWGDLSSLAQVRTLAAQVDAAAPTLDVLLNNAGVFMTERRESADGYELTFAVNHLAPFLLTRLLLPKLRRSSGGRVVNVSSMAHARGRLDLEDLDLKRGYDGYGAYASSKLCNVYFTHELARRLAGTAVTTTSLHPGVISTKLLRTGFGMGGASLESGARTSVHCALSKEAGEANGRYFSAARLAREAPHANDPALEGKLWEISAQRCGL
jgi:NAD(P)-dependent dehydrogenase (short-subunit alcohol dehydrogenase family)